MARTSGEPSALGERIERLSFEAAERLISGYRPSVWCLDKGCHAPIPAGTATCPECGTAQRRACTCTDGWRNQPLQGCPHCQGTGAVG